MGAMLGFLLGFCVLANYAIALTGFYDRKKKPALGSRA